MTSQVEYPVTQAGAAGNAVLGSVPMTLDGTGTPQAVSQAYPIPVVDAYVSPQVTTWTSATAQNTAVTMNTAGMDSVALTIQTSGTITAGSITFEVYDGANWVALGASPTAAVATAGSIYVPANFPMPPIAVTGGTTKIAVIEASAAGSLSIIESV